MATFTTSGVKISGFAACVPRKEVSNYDYKWVSAKEREQLVKTIGVEKRRHVEKGTTTSDMCQAAAEALINGMQVDRSQINLLIFVSQTRDYLIPQTSNILQDKMGLPKTCLSIDVSLGCSGYVYGLAMASGMMNAFNIDKALLLVGDISSLNSAYRDKSTYPLFGDAGTATLLERDKDAPPLHFSLEGDGSGYKAIIIPDGGMRNFLSKKSFDYKKIAPGVYRSPLHVALDGIEVFNFSLREVVPNIKQLLKFSGEELTDFDYVVFHQANKLINDTLRKMLKLPPEKVPLSIGKYGNTSSASIPLTIVSELQNEVRGRNLKLLLSAFGIGLSWGTASLVLQKPYCPNIVEI
ncbi:MAG: 3-oxoacyl-[acyl-carrier-protein] synthase [Bacteroidales bacterium]|jgi:3-oxoacyl-[acyl-carrier-protein] synthase-3|nr:3-oxoacyl-[acyl-carrier-protein] synthase [Bacteroidales bacterium]MDN5330511.1 3-oxoacyl-[acyl-carrier-protein] synthase [Bacteroidales bacterium]